MEMDPGAEGTRPRARACASTQGTLDATAMNPCFNTGLYTGPVAALLGGADISMLVGLPVSALVYLFACRDFDAASERLAVQRADAGLHPGLNCSGDRGAP